MPKVSNKKITSNPSLNEVVYSVLRSASKQELLQLRGKFLQAARSDKKAKFFVANSTYDEKAALLAEFGIRFFTLVVNDEKVTNSDLKKLLDKFESEQKLAAVNFLSDKEIYVISDKEHVHLLGLMASLSNHPSYKLNLEHNRAGYHGRKWTASVKNKNDRSVVDAIASAEYNSRVMLFASLMADRAEVLFEMTATQVKILLYLYAVRHTHVNREKVASIFAGEISVTVVNNTLKKLVDSMHVEKHPTASPYTYTITTKGIILVNRFMLSVFNQIQP